MEDKACPFLSGCSDESLNWRKREPRLSTSPAGHVAPQSQEPVGAKPGGDLGLSQKVLLALPDFKNLFRHKSHPVSIFIDKHLFALESFLKLLLC